MKVLLVDDEEKFALMLSKRLELRGIAAEVFYSGEKALTAVEHGGHFDVAVLDVKMPVIGGIELKHRLSALDPRMKFVFLTGHGSMADGAIGTHEAVETLPKPLKIEELIETLNRLTEITQNATDAED